MATTYLVEFRFAKDAFLSRRLKAWFDAHACKIHTALHYGGHTTVVRATLARFQLEKWKITWRDFIDITVKVLSKDGREYERPRDVDFVLRPRNRHFHVKIPHHNISCPRCGAVFGYSPEDGCLQCGASRRGR